MRDRQAILQALTEPGIVAVVRAGRPLAVEPLVEALLAGGVVAIEITLTTPGALEALAVAVRGFAPKAVMGAGSVVNAAQGKAALAAGAEFLVSPILRPELVPLAHGAGRPVMLGAYTPTEAQAAHEAGADFVKIFPADGLGARYLKAIRGPLPHLRLVPTGGVDLTTLADFVRAGCPAVGVGSSLVSAERLEREDWAGLTELAGRYVAAMREARTARTAGGGSGAG